VLTTAQSATLAGREAAEALMLDTCIVTRGGTGAVFDENTGTWSTPTGTAIYAGKCKLQTRDVAVASPDVAGTQAYVVQWQVHLPIVGSEDVRRGDTVLMTACELDSAHLGRTFTVNGPHVGTAKTARRLPVEAEVSSWP
jgi:hypothetical protein